MSTTSTARKPIRARKSTAKTVSGARDGFTATPMAIKIGVMGAATGAITTQQMIKARELGRAIARNGCVLITGACPGLPLAAACGAREEGGMVVGISPGLSLDEHVGKYHSPTQFHDVLIFTGSGLMGREVVNIRSSDIVVIVGGRSGTLGELAIAYDEGRLIGVLTGMGGISDLVPDIIAVCAKETGAQVVYQAKPHKLITDLLRVYLTSHVRRPSCFHLDRPPGEQATAMPGTSRDPVCGMWIVSESAAAERNHQGQHYVFCSTACVERFDADPPRYVLRSTPGSASQAECPACYEKPDMRPTR